VDQGTAAGVELDSCTITEEFDQCNNEILSCVVDFINPYTELPDTADCLEFEAALELPDECDYSCTDPVLCEENSLTDECMLVECLSSCEYQDEDLMMCWAEWTDQYGEVQDTSCQAFYDAIACYEREGDDVDVCDYDECLSEEGGECWVELCNYEPDDCRPESCTRWEFSLKANYWTAYDCTDYEDMMEDEMEAGDWISELFGELHNYEETIDALSEGYCDTGNCVDEAVDDFMELLGLERPIETNAETIDAILLDEGSQEIA